MTTRTTLGALFCALLVAGCGSEDAKPADTAGADTAGQDTVDPGDGTQDLAEQDVTPTDADDAQVVDAAPACVGSAIACALGDEGRASDQLEAVKDDPEALQAFLKAMPKGGDLHMHLSGAVYAETYMEWARNEGGYCIENGTMAITTTCSSGSTSPVPTPSDALFQKVVRAWSMQDFVPGSETGEDHFFATFGKFGAMSGSAHHAQCLADVMQRADSENMLYVEPMLISNWVAGDEGSKVWTGGSVDEEDFPVLHAALLADAAWPASPKAIVDDIEKTESGARQLLGCDGPTPASACRVGARYMVYISRSASGPKVFAQMVAAFEAAIVEPRLVAVNLVGPEDSLGALKPYDRQMQMLGYLHDAYAGKSALRISLHAGELAQSYMPSGYVIEEINHIRKAVQVAKAERIGHGLDVLTETDGLDLMTEMRNLGVMVEINLSSNVQILEISGANHPLATYLQQGVPVALSTDDQGVSRSSPMGEHMRAVQDQKLDYMALKKLARTSLEKSFLPGASLWTSLSPLQPVPECAATESHYPGDTPVPADCQKWLDGNAKAKTQWELEHRFRVFEAVQG
jgi:adenosine deaminase